MSFRTELSGWGRKWNVKLRDRLGVQVRYLTSEMRLVRVTLNVMVTVSSDRLTGLCPGS